MNEWFFVGSFTYVEDFAFCDFCRLYLDFVPKRGVYKKEQCTKMNFLRLVCSYWILLVLALAVIYAVIPIPVVIIDLLLLLSVISAWK